MNEDLREHQGECQVCGVTAKIGLHYGAVTCFRSKNVIILESSQPTIASAHWALIRS